jgi:hypothetical protein
MPPKHQVASSNLAGPATVLNLTRQQEEALPSLTVQPAASLRPSMLLLLDASGFVAAPARVVIRF